MQGNAKRAIKLSLHSRIEQKEARLLKLALSQARAMGSEQNADVSVFQDFKIGRDGLVIHADVSAEPFMIDQLAIVLRKQLDKITEGRQLADELFRQNLFLEIGLAVGLEERGPLALVVQPAGFGKSSPLQASF